MTNQNLKEKKSSGKGLIIFALVLLGITLPFHYVPSHLKVFPKNNLTFSHTIILQSDIDDLIIRYNNASVFEKKTMRNEPFVRKLMEEGIIIEKK